MANQIEPSLCQLSPRSNKLVWLVQVAAARRDERPHHRKLLSLDGDVARSLSTVVDQCNIGTKREKQLGTGSHDPAVAAADQVQRSVPFAILAVQVGAQLDKHSQR
jgi:hypothetical protein